MAAITTETRAPQAGPRAPGRAEKPVGLFTGQESVEELRNLIILMTAGCSNSSGSADCPLRILSGLTYDSMANWVNSLSRADCLDLIYQAYIADCKTKSSCRRIRERTRVQPQQDAQS